MIDTPDTIFVFWSKDRKHMRLWTSDRERAKSFAAEIGEEPQPFHTACCVECNDEITAHDPGVCGTCYAVKYEIPEVQVDRNGKPVPPSLLPDGGKR